MILDLGSTPYEEFCAQIVQEGYNIRARKEAEALIGQLKRMFGDSKEVSYQIKYYYGTYYSVQLSGPSDYVMKVDNEFPANWDEQARKELE